VIIIIGGYILLLKPLFIIPAAIIITFLSIIIYKREILLPERHNPKAWIDSIFLIVVGLFFISLIKNQVIINQFGELFIDGGIKDFDRPSEGENGNEFWEEYLYLFLILKKAFYCHL
jgi:tellurite resistance protein TehA-like permease